MSMYVRVKRGKQTFFLLVEPSDTVLELKQKVQALTDKPVELQRLLIDNVAMEDAKTLADMKVENDAIIALTYGIEVDGEEGEKLLNWEPINIETLEGPEVMAVEVEEGGDAEPPSAPTPAPEEPAATPAAE
mmetsp:Transcript_12429/g.39363  ORF Transcript_12429/g.39363 Transcript_12429/m.39363 type:complete len:132 (-) Transcript_12429:86-481(-)|eukprot:CAMPEP_0182912942 /NCGR_PEP_ID=MMETSP0034_2-20130328/37782_1 /TAXON_ID=156128 /ORGANISM="Nephroselmis pyriformis, Strain CCMP717" /LENGTH=131 /DNA_ID=CAMNT_0025049639 /DNA_START=131 /DNA_END=526 /DNA_ORIENTATION=+